ncbi:helix-turn-helix domain-containing protein, partial [Salmonella enterica subsp. enterica]|nr:helix-turn-helix domain-containing protein [Salmonella enterica subsp. enterica]
MNREIQRRLQWVKLNETFGDAGFVYRCCGISRPTLRKWWRRYLVQGITGLESHSRRSKHSPSTKTGSGEVTLIL